MQIEYTKSVNGEQLLQELRLAGVKIALDDYPKIEDNVLTLNVSTKDEAKALEVWNAHIAEDWNAKNAIAKASVLARLGITEEEAKLLLS